MFPFGAPGGKFRPDATMTRAEVCALLAQALDVYSKSDGYFADVPKGSWYASSVNAMASLGLVTGVGGGKFAPDATMTQEEFITVLGRFVEFLNLDARAFLDKMSRSFISPRSTPAQLLRRPLPPPQSAVSGDSASPDSLP